MSSTSVTEVQVREALAGFPDPETGRDAIEMNQLQDVRVDGSRVSIRFAVTTHSFPIWADVQQSLIDRIKQRLSQVDDVQVERAEHERPAPRAGEMGIPVRSVITVGSGKGGVGKSTVSTSLAFALNRMGAKVGILDADVYGPSVPHLTGTLDQAPRAQQGLPAVVDGVSVMSIGYLVPADQAVVWRGPLLHRSITQMLGQTQWGELDYLVIDMPPGTGDVALTLSQIIPTTGAVVVCTPQEVALLDAVKAISMFRTVNIPILGMVENMSGFLCPDCNKRYDIFGSGGARAKAMEMDVPFLGEIPINIGIRESGDNGSVASIVQDPVVAPYFEKLAYNLVRNIAMMAEKEPPQTQLPVLG
ncbi:MAG: Mrp/NBP35 family ATP-binding protein [Pirellulaceae bacterium]|nr:MRP family ATP-binding protein [Planctomycetaceae bacterium]